MSDNLMNTLAGRFSELASELFAWLDQHAVNIIIILIGAWVIRRFGSKAVGSLLIHTVRRDHYPTKADREKRIRTLNTMTRAILGAGVTIVAFVLILGEVNPNYATALFASLGLLTVAVGLGARDVIKDVLSGFFIISESQYRVGDDVEIAGVSGTVEAITVRSTVLRDQFGDVHHVANGGIGVATNKTIGYSQLSEEIIVDLKTDLDRLAHIINHTGEEVAARPELKDKVQKAPFFDGVDGYKQGGVVAKVNGTTLANDKYLVRSEFYKLLTKALVKYDIQVIAPVPPAAPDKK